MQSSSCSQLFVGIDVAATTFTVSWSFTGSDPWKAITLSQTPTGYATLQQRLTATGCPSRATLIVLEATGSYWVTLAVAFHEAGYRVSVVHPVHIVNYAKSLTRRAKTDPRDAQLLVRFAAE